MKIGTGLRSLEQPIRIDRYAAMMEDRGFESIWVPEHVVIPVTRSPHPFDEPLPRWYWTMPDPWIMLSYAAHATTRLRLGTSICILPEHEPINLAKTLATLDQLSGGRVILGIGGGWLKEEMELFGVPFEKRWAAARERVLAMRRLWTEEESEFHGKYVDFPKVLMYPKPAQKPHIPVYVGAGSRWARQRVVDWGDGWMPSRMNPVDFARRVEDIRQRAAAKGRDMATISINAISVRPTVEEVRAFADAGAERVTLALPEARTEREAIANLDRAARELKDLMETD